MVSSRLDFRTIPALFLPSVEQDSVIPWPESSRLFAISAGQWQAALPESVKLAPGIVTNSHE